MRVELIDVDGHRFPNLPLMKISAYHKSRGDSVGWHNPLTAWLNPPDRVYMSKVFTFTPDYQHPVNAQEIIRGGTGYSYPDGGAELPEEIEHIYPDYSIYFEKIPEVKETAYGFLTRGCPRGCDFCIVGQKEGRAAKKVADLSEFWRGQKNIVLLDTPNALQMQQIQDNVCTHFGTNMDILQNKFDEETWNAYYEGKIEPFAIQLSLVMSNMAFSQRELAHGNAITFSANRLQYASNATKLQVSTQLFDRALLNRNGVMDIWNMPHVEDGEKYYIRKEYTEVSQLGKSEEKQQIIIQQMPQPGQQAAGTEPGEEPAPDDKGQKEGVTDAGQAGQGV